MGAKLRIVRRKEPFAMITLRIAPEDKSRIEKVAAENEATVTDVVISALIQTGVLPDDSANVK